MHSKLITVEGVRTHLLEAGSGPALVLLHSGEFGACAELSWEHNFSALARHFHVVAPDWLGYGKTEKLFSFENMRAKRIAHIAGLLRELGIGRAHFIGNSMGGTMLLEVGSCPGAWCRSAAVIALSGELGRMDQAGTADSLTMGSSLTGAMVSRLM